MPMYEYKCPKCGTLETKVVNIENSNRQLCSNCGTYLQKLVSAPKTIKINGVKATTSM